jgi:TPR repeat protein
LAADKNYIDAYYNLGNFNFLCKGVIYYKLKEYTLSIKYYNLALENGITKATYNLGLFFFNKRESL